MLLVAKSLGAGGGDRETVSSLVQGGGVLKCAWAKYVLQPLFS
jgi:hypothetical protein